VVSCSLFVSGGAWLGQRVFDSQDIGPERPQVMEELADQNRFFDVIFRAPRRGQD
jgi:hypothetical protein